MSNTATTWEKTRLSRPGRGPGGYRLPPETKDQALNRMLAEMDPFQHTLNFPPVTIGCALVMQDQDLARRIFARG